MPQGKKINSIWIIHFMKKTFYKTKYLEVKSFWVFPGLFSCITLVEQQANAREIPNGLPAFLKVAFDPNPQRLANLKG